MRRFTDQRVRQYPHGSRDLICPHCLSLTEHHVVEEVQQETVFGVPIRSGARQAVFMCSQCGEEYSVPWNEYLASRGPASPTEKDLGPPVFPKRVIVLVLIITAVLAAAILIPAVAVMLR